jgi:signal transduction histidine kinase
VDHLLYGQRDDPATVLERLQAGFESVSDPGTLLDTIASIITDTLKLPYVAFELAVAGRQIATHAGSPTNPAVKIPLLYRQEKIGHMLVAPRAADELLSAADEKLLRQIAVQTTAAIRAMYLAEDLQRVRAGLVATREEERRRLRRDLHDSVGPVLASQGLKMAAVQELVEQDPETARHLIEDLIEQNEHTVAEIRRLVYGLRPPALDELGLVGAISDFAADLDHGKTSQGRLAVRVHSPQEGLPPLPAAVEVAAYRIATEAITNVARHASAQRCDIRLSLEQDMPGTPLLVEVTDNGRGLPAAPRSGVGTNSMRERAQEIGGVLEIVSKPEQGTRVRARLPLGGIAL